MILPMHRASWIPIPHPVPQRRRVIVLGATEAGVSCAFHLDEWAMLIEQRDIRADSVVNRWEPPQLATEESFDRAPTWNDLWSALMHLTSGETRIGTRAAAIDVHERRLQVSTGESFVYDKLVSSLRMKELQRLIVDEVPRRLQSEEAWRHWLNARDIELLDEPTRKSCGDMDGHAAGKRVADVIRVAMLMKYSTKPAFGNRAPTLFHPKIVGLT